MAGILMMRPQLYVVDEPLANLDPLSAARLLAILRALADEGNAVVIVEHRVEEALGAATRSRALPRCRTRPATSGPVDGFLRIADPRAVKLPFEVVLERARSGGLSAAPPGPAGDRPRPAASPDDRNGTPPPRLALRAGRCLDRRASDPARRRCRPGPTGGRGHPRAQRLGQDDRLPDGHAAAAA